MSTFRFLLTLLLTAPVVTARAHPPEECECAIGTSNAPPIAANEVHGEIILPFTQFNGNDVELVYDSRDARVSLRTRTNTISREPLQFLASQVQEIVNTKGAQFPLGDSGYTVEFRSGYPSWGPTTRLGHEGDYKYLMFGERAELSGRTIIIHGRSTPPPYSWY